MYNFCKLRLKVRKGGVKGGRGGEGRGGVRRGGREVRGEVRVWRGEERGGGMSSS